MKPVAGFAAVGSNCKYTHRWRAIQVGQLHLLLFLCVLFTLGFLGLLGPELVVLLVSCSYRLAYLPADICLSPPVISLISNFSGYLHFDAAHGGVFWAPLFHPKMLHCCVGASGQSENRKHSHILLLTVFAQPPLLCLSLCHCVTPSIRNLDGRLFDFLGLVVTSLRESPCIECLLASPLFWSFVLLP